MWSCVAIFCLAFVVESSAGLFDWKTVTQPSLKIIPESEGNFIFYNQRHASSYQRYIDSMTSFLEPYKRVDIDENVRHCNFNNPLTENSVCDFDVRNIGSTCSQENNFGFHRARPCLFFTLSQVLDWTPVVLNGSDIQQHSDPFLNMPNNLNYTIAYNEEAYPPGRYVWMSCDGDIGADKEFVGPVSYFPERGFPTYYFPYKNIKGYRSPIVAVQFERPQRGVVITIICKAWAKNIQLDEKNELGFVKFQLLIDD